MDEKDKKFYKKYIPEKFKEKYKMIEEIHIKKINQESVESIKKSLGKGLLDSKLKLVGIKLQFLSEEGVLCESGYKSNGFDEEEWNE